MYRWNNAPGFTGSGATLLVGRCARVRMHHAGKRGALTREALGGLAEWVHQWGVQHELPVHLVPSGGPSEWDEQYEYEAKKPSGIRLPRISVGLLVAQCGLGKFKSVDFSLKKLKKQAAGIGMLCEALDARPEATAIFTATETNGESVRWRATAMREASDSEVAPILAVSSNVSGAVIIGVEAKSGAHKKRGMRDWGGNLFGKVFPTDEAAPIEVTDAKIRAATKSLKEFGEAQVYLAAHPL